MKNLKPVYDAVIASEAKVAGILNEMQTAFDEGTEEGKIRALELRPALDEAKAEANDANLLYISMRDASPGEDSPARLFVPVSDDAQHQKKVITRAEYEALTYEARYKFYKDGGTIVDEASE